MPNIEDLERLGSIAFLMGKKKLPKELSKEDYDSFKSVFTNEYMENSAPSEDNDLPNIDDLLNDNTENLNLQDNSESEDDKITADLDDLDLPEDFETEEKKEDEKDEKIENKKIDDKITDNSNDLKDSDNIETEDNKISIDLNDLENQLPILDELPLPEDLPNVEESDNETIMSDDLGIGDISHLSNGKDSFDDSAIEETLEENDDYKNIEENIDDNEDLEEILEENDNDENKESEEEILANSKIEEPPEIKEPENIDNLTEDDLIKEDVSDIDTKDIKDIEENKIQTEEEFNLDDLENILDEYDDDKDKKIENKEDISNLDNLESILDEEEIKPQTSETKEIKEESSKENEFDLDDLEGILDDEKEEAKTEVSEEVKEIKREETKPKDDIVNLDDLDDLSDLENIFDEEDSKIEEPQKTEELKETEDKTIENEEKEDLPDLDNLDNIDDIDGVIEEDNVDNKEEPVQIMEGGTSLPSPDTADKLGPSKYEYLGENIDHDKVIDSIKNLSPLTRYHVLDVILNEKLDADSMKELLLDLEGGKSNEDITEFINKELGLSIKEYGKSGILDLIPIPNSLKDYANIIRIAAVFLILFVGIVLLSYQFIYKPVKANQYFKRGLADIQNGAYSDAERNFSEGEKLKPKQIKWYNRYGKAYVDRERFPNALEKIEGALSIKPRDFDSRVLFGYYYRNKGEKQLSEEDYIKGEELYNDMLSYVSKKNQLKTVYDELGILMISRARNLSQPAYYDNAYNNYIDMINIFGDNVIARKRAMLIRIYQNNYNQVKAIQRHIDNLKRGYIDDDVYPKLARYLLNNDDFYGARTLLEKILKKYPTNIEAIVGYADYETRLKHYERARDILIHTALPLFDENIYQRGKEFVYNMLGQIYYNLEEYGSAINNFNAALEINQTYPDANYNLANLYFYQDKDYEKAKEHYRIAYDNLPPELRGDQLLYNLSWIYYLNNEFDRAFEGFNALFQKNPSNSVVSYALGNSLLHLDRANLANGFYRNALNQILARRERLGRLEMRTESDFFLLSYLASLYNNIGVSYAYNSLIGNTVQNEQEAFRNFVLASEYFDQVRTSNIDLERMERRTILVENNNIGVATYNVMAVQGRRNLKESVMIDDYMPKNMYYVR